MCGGALTLGKLFHQRPKILRRKAVVGVAAIPPALPSRNFRITGRTFHAPYLWLRHPPARSAVYFLPCAVAPLLWENFFIKGPPKILHRTALVGAPAVPPTLPSRNFQNTGRTFYARIYGSGPYTIPGQDIFVGAPTIPTRVPLLMAACLPRASARSPHAAMRIPLSVVATC